VLASIKGYMEGLIDGVLPAEAATFQRVYREADWLQWPVHDWQELSRVEAGAYELNLRPTAPERLVYQERCPGAGHRSLSLPDLQGGFMVPLTHFAILSSTTMHYTS
jgi:hypothetical protein